MTRFRPDDQSGNGFVRDLVSSSVRSGWKGLKTGGPLGLPLNIRGAVRGVTQGGKRAVKRKALAEVNRLAKKQLTDLFGK